MEYEIYTANCIACYCVVGYILNSKARDFFYNNQIESLNTNGGLSVKYRYGAKIGLGFQLIKHVHLFANYGIARTSYNINIPKQSDVGNLFNKIHMINAPIYGFGAMFVVNNNLSLKLAFDRQKFRAQYLPLQTCKII